MSKKRKVSQNSLDALRHFERGFDPRRNLGGRPRSAALRARAAEISSDGKRTFAEAAAAAIFNTALGGSASAFDSITDRLEGKPKQNVAQNIDLDVGGGGATVDRSGISTRSRNTRLLQ